MTHPLEFVKMEAAGNDFVLIDCRNQDIPLEAIITMCPALCDRKRGIGADGLLLLHPNPNPDVDYTMIYRNSDGSDAGMCGNGGRCIVAFAKKINLIKFKQDFEILSVLRNLKIIGIFTRLAYRDNKKKYIQLIPYAWEMIDYRLKQNKIFKDLKLLLKNNFPEFIN